MIQINLNSLGFHHWTSWMSVLIKHCIFHRKGLYGFKENIVINIYMQFKFMKNIIVVGMGKNLINFQTYLVLFTTLKAENISQNKLQLLFKNIVVKVKIIINYLSIYKMSAFITIQNATCMYNCSRIKYFSNSMLIFLYHQNYCKDCRSTKTLTAIILTYKMQYLIC